MPIISFIIAHSNLLLAIALGIVICYALYLDHKIVVLTRGATGASLEDIIRACVDATAKIQERNELISKHALVLDERVSHAIRNAQTVRYKAFDTND